MAKYLIDTDLYVELLRTGESHSIIAELYARETPYIYFSSVVAQELLSGVISEDGKKNVETLIRPFERAGRIVTPGHRVWKASGEALSLLRRQRPDLKSKLPRMINDTLIALSARSIGAAVVTSNAADFEAIRSVAKFSFVTVARP